MKTLKSNKLWILFGTLLPVTPWTAEAGEIIRPYFSTRSAGMGGVIMTTGQYADNFYNNPARVTANPRSRFTLFQASPDVSSTAIQIAKSGGSTEDQLINHFGSGLHAGVQLVLPSFYIAPGEDGKWGFAFGILANTQAGGFLHQSYSTELDVLATVGPALTIGRKFLDDDALSVGITGRYSVAAATHGNVSVTDYLNGSDLVPKIGLGSKIDFDIGSTYKVATFDEFVLNAGFAIQNVLNAQYSKFDLISSSNLSTTVPTALGRTLGAGLNLSRATLGYFTDSVLAFEATDALNNTNGSLFRLLHLGAETHWTVFALRAGINQGYWTAGLGIDLRFLTLDFASYGAELGLNAGTYEDRRYSASIGFHI